MDRARHVDQNMFIEHLQIMHRMISSNMLTWHQKITESVRKTATATTLLNKLGTLSTQLTKIHGIHPWKDGMARQPTVRRHVYEAKTGKNKFIGYMDH